MGCQDRQRLPLRGRGLEFMPDPETDEMLRQADSRR
jgi:hypothetical protein